MLSLLFGNIFQIKITVTDYVGKKLVTIGKTTAVQEEWLGGTLM